MRRPSCPPPRPAIASSAKLRLALTAPLAVAIVAGALVTAPPWRDSAQAAAAYAGPGRASFVPDRVVVAFAPSSRRALREIAQAVGARGEGEELSTEAALRGAGLGPPLEQASAGARGPRARGPHSWASVAGALRRRPQNAPLLQTRVLTLAHGVPLRAALLRLRRRRRVLWAVPDYIAHAAAAEYVPDDPGSSQISGGWRLLQWDFASPFGVGAPEAWANLIADGAPGGRAVTVAVLDTGVAYENRGRFVRSPDFEASQFVKGHDFVAGSKHPDDRNGHGTFVAGAIAEATNNGRGLTGLAYGARIMPVRVLDASGEGDAATIARGVRFAVSHGAKVINLSLEFSGEVSAADVPELISALAYAHEHGVVIVAAAGNEGSTDVPYPAKDRFAIAVGASTEHGCLASYSNYGRGIDLVAPGGGADADLPGDPNCHPTAPPGRDVYQETYTGLSPRIFGFPGGYEGTSMASPLVAASAALVIASGVLGPDPPPAAVRWRLQQTARPLGDPADAADYGHGLLDAAAATAPGGPGAAISRR